MRIGATIVFFFFLSTVVNGQSVKGQVTDENGNPIAFTTLLLDADPSRGSIADIDGLFEILLPADFSSIHFSNLVCPFG